MPNIATPAAQVQTVSKKSLSKYFADRNGTQHLRWRLDKFISNIARVEQVSEDRATQMYQILKECSPNIEQFNTKKQIFQVVFPYESIGPCRKRQRDFGDVELRKRRIVDSVEPNLSAGSASSITIENDDDVPTDTFENDFVEEKIQRIDPVCVSEPQRIHGQFKNLAEVFELLEKLSRSTQNLTESEKAFIQASLVNFESTDLNNVRDLLSGPKFLDSIRALLPSMSSLKQPLPILASLGVWSILYSTTKILMKALNDPDIVMLFQLLSSKF